METKSVIKSQYLAALAMLKQAVEACPEALWLSPAYKNRTWHIAYHVLFYTHFYLHPTDGDFVPWPRHRPEFTSLSDAYESGDPPEPTKADVLDYIAFCEGQVVEKVDALDFDAASGFYWLPFNKLELQFYNIRHLMLHTGELAERLGAHGEHEVGWVGLVKPER